jgi:glycosyltransferase involved in cell wall biosynthesis
VSPRVLLTVSGVIPDDVDQQVALGVRPRPDYRELARAMGADTIDVAAARTRIGRLAPLLERLGGAGALLAWACFRLGGRYDVIVADGEQVGLPLAILWRLTLRRHRPAHVMIAHIMSVPKKVLLFRHLHLGRLVDLVLVYSSWQQAFIRRELGLPAEQVVLTTFMVDTHFFSSDEVGPEPEQMICSAGLERRDYATLIDAVRGLDVRVVIAAASPWSKLADTTGESELPANVEVCRLGFVDLRQLYRDARFVVMPLQEVEFQAGVTSILEAMAMGKTVICSRTRGQTDVLEDGVTGVYVTPGSTSELRSAIVDLLDHPDRALTLGVAARRYVERECDVVTYAERLAKLTLEVAAGDAHAPARGTSRG